MYVTDTKFDAVLKAFHPHRHAAKDRAQQKLCESIQNGTFELPMSSDMARVHAFAKTFTQETQDVTIDVARSVLAVDATPFDAKRKERNCEQDYKPEHMDAVKFVRTTQQYSTLHKPMLQLSHKRMQYMANAMARGYPIDYKDVLKKVG